MTVELCLGPEVERQLRRKAAAGGVTLEAYLRAVVERESQVSGDDAPSTTAAGDDEDRPWRGVFILPRPRRAFFPPTTALPALDLPRRECVPNMNWHRVSAEDE